MLKRDHLRPVLLMGARETKNFDTIEGPGQRENAVTVGGQGGRGLLAC